MLTRLMMTLSMVGVLSWCGKSMAATVLWENDFQNGTGVLAINTQLIGTVVADPVGVAGNMVLQVTDTGLAGSATQWGEIRPSPQGLAIAPGHAVAGADAFTMLLRYYIPAETIGGGTDSLRLYIRWGVNTTTDPGSANSNGTGKVLK